MKVNDSLRGNVTIACTTGEDCRSRGSDEAQTLKYRRAGSGTWTYLGLMLPHPRLSDPELARQKLIDRPAPASSAFSEVTLLTRSWQGILGLSCRILRGGGRDGEDDSNQSVSNNDSGTRSKQREIRAEGGVVRGRETQPKRLPTGNSTTYNAITNSKNTWFRVELRYDWSKIDRKCQGAAADSGGAL